MELARTRSGRIGICGAILAAVCSVAVADVPRLVHYQGKLRESGGALVNGTVSLDFKLYGHETNGAPLLFTETHPSVSVANGLFNVLIGSQAGGVPDSALDAAEVYLGIAVNGGAELSPRPRIVSNPHAIKAKNAEQLVKPGTFDAAATVDGSGQVGIGTAAPAATLDVDNDGGTILVPRKSDAGDPAGADGMIYYNTTDGKFRGYENGSWGDLRDGSGSASDPCNCPTNPWTLVGVLNSTRAGTGTGWGTIDISDNSKEYLFMGTAFGSDFTISSSPVSAVLARNHADDSARRLYSALVLDDGGTWRSVNTSDTWPIVSKGALWNPAAGAGLAMSIQIPGWNVNPYARIYGDGLVRLDDQRTDDDYALLIFSRVP